MALADFYMLVIGIKKANDLEYPRFPSLPIAFNMRQSSGDNPSQGASPNPFWVAHSGRSHDSCSSTPTLQLAAVPVGIATQPVTPDSPTLRASPSGPVRKRLRREWAFIWDNDCDSDQPAVVIGHGQFFYPSVDGEHWHKAER